MLIEAEFTRARLEFGIVWRNSRPKPRTESAVDRKEGEIMVDPWRDEYMEPEKSDYSTNGDGYEKEELSSCIKMQVFIYCLRTT
jgi:hypothetical protein